MKETQKITSEDIREAVLKLRQTRYEPPIYVFHPKTYQDAVDHGYIKDGWFTEKFFNMLMSWRQDG